MLYVSRSETAVTNQKASVLQETLEMHIYFIDRCELRCVCTLVFASSKRILKPSQNRVIVRARKPFIKGQFVKDSIVRLGTRSTQRVCKHISRGGLFDTREIPRIQRLFCWAWWALELNKCSSCYICQGVKDQFEVTEEVLNPTVMHGKTMAKDIF